MNREAPITDLDSTELDAIARQLLSPQRTAAQPWPSMARRVSLPLDTPAHWLEGPALELVAHTLGSGPAVMLVHGWQAQGHDMWALAQAVAAQGYSVWVPDLPAHGHSQGRFFSIPLAAQALLRWQQQVGDFAAVLGHSVGGACVVQALSEGLQADKVVLLAVPTHFGSYVREVAQMLGLPASSLPPLLQKMQHLLGMAPDAIDMRQQAQWLPQQPLFVHDPHDKIAPCAPAQQVARSWPGAQWQAVHGVGHFRILHDAQVHQQVLDYLRA